MIAADSKSYPYLALAQRYGIDYGVVLTAADALKASGGNGVSLDGHPHWKAAIEAMHPHADACKDLINLVRAHRG